MYGTNTSLVLEVLETVKSNQLLSGLRDSNEFVVIDDFKEAQRLAWSQFGEDINVPWTDYRSEQMALVMDVRYSMTDFEKTDSQLGALVDQMGDVILKKFKRTELEALADDVASDLYGVAYARGVGGKRFDFFEKIFDAYVSGGWPCGIRNGRLVVFSCRAFN